MKPEGPGSRTNTLSTPTNLNKDTDRDTGTGKSQTGTHSLPDLELQLPEVGSKRTSGKDLPEREVGIITPTPPQPQYPPPAKRMKTPGGHHKKKTTNPENYMNDFENWASTISTLCGKTISAKKLWELSNDGPAKAAKRYLEGKAIRHSTESELHAVLNKVRSRRIMLNKKQITLEFDDSTDKNVTTQPCPPLFPALSSSTDTGYSSETSSLSISSSAIPTMILRIS